MPNRLSGEKSPYLLQHAGNPVNWFPWGDEAFRKAGEEDKPIFLSIGYATCHWCHVMEHESFEDEEVAALLNEHMVAIKVDREERPDIDQVYMTICQALTGRGGWPLSIFMTPQKKAFFAGSYFPKTARMGMPGFVEIIGQLADLWGKSREKVVDAGNRITSAVQPRKAESSESVPGMQLLEKAFHQLRQAFDSTWGGFGAAPKFPTPHHLYFLLRWHRRNPNSEALDLVEKTLDCMRDGGIFDQIGFGFHRYSVDKKWLVPHFEKMLYDQALIAMAYLEAFQMTGKDRHASVAHEIFEYVLRDMTDPGGGFYSAEDADSEGKEGLFYVWTPGEVEKVLGRENSEIFCRYFDITETGNFEDALSIPHVPRSGTLIAERYGLSVQEVTELIGDGVKKLFEARLRRVRPLKDDKVLTSWNGLMIAALAKGARVLGIPEYTRAAAASADFILSSMRKDGGRLYRRFRQGDVSHPAYADDYAFFIWGLIELYETTFDARYLKEALELQKRMIDLFWDESEGGFFFTAGDGENLIVRDKEIYDGALPSSNSVAALNLLRLARMTGNTRLEDKADRVLRRFAGIVGDVPYAHTQFLVAVDFSIGPNREIVLAGDLGNESTAEMVKIVRTGFTPGQVVLFSGKDAEAGELAGLAPFAEGLRPLDGRSTAYVCEGYSCRKPITDPRELREAIHETA